MTPVEWLESRPAPELSITSDGRVCFRGGWATLAQIKSDACKCRTDEHNALPYRMDMTYGYVPPLDPFDVAVKRGAPA